MGVLAGHEGVPVVLCPRPATRDPAGQLRTLPKSRKEPRERRAGGGPMSPGPRQEGHKPPGLVAEKGVPPGDGSPPRASSFAQDQVCLPDPIPGRAGS